VLQYLLLHEFSKQGAKNAKDFLASRTIVDTTFVYPTSFPPEWDWAYDSVDVHQGYWKEDKIVVPSSSFTERMVFFLEWHAHTAGPSSRADETGVVPVTEETVLGTAPVRGERVLFHRALDAVKENRVRGYYPNTSSLRQDGSYPLGRSFMFHEFARTGIDESLLVYPVASEAASACVQREWTEKKRVVPACVDEKEGEDVEVTGWEDDWRNPLRNRGSMILRAGEGIYLPVLSFRMKQALL
jgi:hypothetical protein